MTVITRHTDFRFRFANKVEETGVSCTFADANPDTIARAAGDFVAQGYLAGQSIDIAGSVNNDTRYTIATVAAATLTLASADAVTVEGPVSCNLLSIHRDPDGLEEFPGLVAAENGRTNLVRSGGFTGGLVGIPTPYIGAAFEVTVNATGEDAVFGVDDYDWYMSQRTDDAAVQYLTIVQRADAGGESFSGTVAIAHTANATSVLGLSTPPTPQQVTWLFKHVDLYAKRLSDGAIQWRNLLRAMVANA